MNHVEIADRAGVYLADLESLLRGSATAKVASRLGVTMADVEDFIRGSASQAMATRLGLNTMSAAEELARAGGAQGAIGFLICLLMYGCD